MHDIAAAELGRNCPPELIDPRHALLAQAGAWDVLVSQGAMSLDLAFDSLVTGVDELVSPPPCETCLERAAGQIKPVGKNNRIPENWDTMSIDALWKHFNRNRPTPQATIDAVKHCVRERGPSALEEPENRLRLRDFDDATLAELDRWLVARGVK
jgi:hypothetical protein